MKIISFRTELNGDRERLTPFDHSFQIFLVAIQSILCSVTRHLYLYTVKPGTLRQSG